MLQIYHGDGKGKTTAAAGLAIRAAGRGIPVVFTQFLKDGSSGELSVMDKLDNVKLVRTDCFYGFVRNMTSEQKEQTRKAYSELLLEIDKIVIEKLLKDSGEPSLSGQTRTDVSVVVVLDEVLHAVNNGLVAEDDLIEYINKWNCKENGRTELILTGRNPSKRLLALADYITEMKKCRHPFDKGVSARYGIEL